MVIIEGLDKCGKTTLIGKLFGHYKEYGYYPRKFRTLRPDVHKMDFSNPTEYIQKEFNKAIRVHLCTITELQEKGCIGFLLIDRFHFTEYSYLEPNDPKDLSYIWDIDHRLAISDFRTRVIYLSKPVSSIFESMDNDELRTYKIKQYEEYDKRMHYIFEKSELEKIEIDTYMNDIQKTFELAIKFLEG